MDFYLLCLAWPETKLWQNKLWSHGGYKSINIIYLTCFSWRETHTTIATQPRISWREHTHITSNRRWYECFLCFSYGLHDFNFSSVHSSSAASIYFGLYSENKPSKRPLVADTRAPVWGDMKCESLAALRISSPSVPPFLSMCCWDSVATSWQTRKFITGWCWLDVWSETLCRWLLTESRTARNTII